MKKLLLSSLLFFFTLVAFAASIDLQLKNVTVEKAISALKQKSNYSIVLNSDEVDLTKIVSVNARNSSIDEVLKQILVGQNVSYSIKGNKITIARSSVSISQTSDVAKTVSGVVTNQNGEPVMGAGVVSEQNSNVGTITGIDGKWSLKVTTGTRLKFSSIGYETKVVTVGESNMIDVILEEDKQLLDEVVVTALGVKRSEKALGYSVQKVDSDKLVTSKGINIATSLTGKVAGLNVQNTTEFYDSPTMLLRGEAPRIIVDGVPYSTVGLDQISPDDIESIDVLKGATASALYGSKGSTGVIMVTTKKGAANEGISVDFNSNTMFFSGYLAFPETQGNYSSGTSGVMNYNSCWGDRLDIGHTALMYNPLTYKVEEQELTSKGKDNFRNFLQLGLVTNNNVSLSQKGKYGSIRASMTHIYNRGQYHNQDLNKFNFTLGGEIKYKKFSMTASAGYNRHGASNYHGKGYSGSYIYNLVIWGAPQYDIREFRDYWVSGMENEQQNWYESSWYNNPYFEAYEIIDKYSTDFMNASLTANYEIAPWLKAVVRGGVDSKSVREEWRNPISATTGAWGKDGKYGIQRSFTSSINTDAMLMAEKSFGKFGIEALAGGNLYFYNWDRITAETMNGLNVPGFYSLNASVDTPQSSSAIQRQRINSLYGKITLSWDNIFFLDVTGRNDWSSTLSAAEKSYFYPSVAGSVVLSDLIPMPEWWDFLKARGSWTMTKTPADIYAINNAYTITSEVWSGMKGAYYPSTLKGGLVMPQSSQTWEVGLNAKFFKNRLYTDFAFYQKNEYDFIRDGGVSPTTGFSAVQINCSETRRRQGFEITLGGRPVETRDFSWDIVTNWGHDNYTYQAIDPEYSTKKSWVYEGADWDWISAWDWQRDPDGNLVISGSGYPIWMPVETKMGKSTPDLVWGVGNTFRFKNWTVSFSFDGRVGGTMWAQTYQAIMNSGACIETDTPERYEEVVNHNVTFVPKGVNVVSGSVSYDASGDIIEDTRTFKENDVAVSYEAFTSYYYGQRSSAYQQCMLDATFFKLRDFSIVYDIPKAACEKMKIKGASVGVTGQNVLLWTKSFKYADPDKGVDDINAPSQRYLGYNIKLNF